LFFIPHLEDAKPIFDWTAYWIVSQVLVSLFSLLLMKNLYYALFPLFQLQPSLYQ